jgi:hypothetical protein
VRLQSGNAQGGSASHSRVDAAIPLISQPEWLYDFPSFWRADFDVTPTILDLDRNNSIDWVAGTGTTFVITAGPGQMTNGTWHANGDLATNPANDFSQISIVEARCRNMAASGVSADVLRVNADWVGAAHAALIIRMQQQLDGSQTMSLLRLPSSGAAVPLPADAGSMLSTSIVDNLTNDYVWFRLIILPAQNKVNLHVNHVDVGTFTYQTDGPATTDKCVKILGSGGAKFDYVEVRVLND